MDWMSMAMMVLPVVVTIVFGYFAVAGKIATVGKEAGELLVTAMGALQDGKLTKEEIQMIVKEARDVKEAVMAIKKKEQEK